MAACVSPLSSAARAGFARCLQTEHSVHKCREDVRAARDRGSLTRGSGGFFWSELHDLNLEVEGGAPGLSSQRETAPLVNFRSKGAWGPLLVLGACSLNSAARGAVPVPGHWEQRADPPCRLAEVSARWPQQGGGREQPAPLRIEGETSRASPAPRVGPGLLELGVVQKLKEYINGHGAAALRGVRGGD